MKKSKMLKEDLKSLREQENAEIVQHLEAISEIITTKCKRCDFAYKIIFITLIIA